MSRLISCRRSTTNEVSRLAKGVEVREEEVGEEVVGERGKGGNGYAQTSTRSRPSSPAS